MLLGIKWMSSIFLIPSELCNQALSQYLSVIAKQSSDFFDTVEVAYFSLRATYLYSAIYLYLHKKILVTHNY